MFMEGEAPVMIGYIPGDEREGPKVSILYWGDSKHREASMMITSEQFTTDTVNRFYDGALDRRKKTGIKFRFLS